MGESPVQRAAPRCTRLAPACGVEVHDVDLTQLADTDIQDLLALLDEYKVVVVRGADITPAEHVDLARRFGPLQLHPYLADLRSPQPYILVMEGDRALAPTYHTDESFLETPPVTCLLRMHTLPRSGGATTWINLEAAYAALPIAIRNRLADAYGIHRTLDGDREADHPLVRAHPRTGRPALFLSRLYSAGIKGADDEAGALLDELLEHSEDSSFACQLEWTPGDFVIWDNCCTVHRVDDDFNTFRRVERVAVAGQRPEPFGA